MARFSPVLRLPLLGFGLIAPLAALGAMTGFRSSAGVRALVTALAVYCASVVAFFVFSRYRMPAVSALLPLAAIGIVELVSRVRERRGLVAAAVVLAAAAAVAFLRIGIFAADHPIATEMRLRHHATVQRQAGNVDGAIATLQEAVAPCPPGCPRALHDLFETYRETGRAAEGTTWFRAFIRAHPEQRDAPGYLRTLDEARDRR
jgi:hypothetical protein